VDEKHFGNEEEDESGRVAYLLKFLNPSSG